MSEPEQETPEPQEPGETPEPGETEVEPEPEPEAPVTPTEPDEQEPQARDDHEIEVLYTRLETRAKNYVKSISEILDGSGVPVTICEMCADAYPGVRWVEPRDELHAALTNVAEESGRGAPLREDADAEECPKCGGWGVVKLPSHVPGNEHRTCTRCFGAGYLVPHPGSGTHVAPAADAPNGPAEPIAGVPLDDPAVADLVARGYTVVPPMQIAGPVE